MRRTKQDAARTRDAILASALDSFAEHGWDRSTMEGIGQRIGLTRGAVCHHFRDKATLLRAVLVEGWAGQSEQLLAPLRDERRPPVQRLTDFLADYLVKLDTAEDLRALVIVTTFIGRHIDTSVDDHRLATDVWREHLTRTLEQCTLQSELSVEHVVFSVIALINGAALESSLDPTRLPEHGAARAIATAAVRGWVLTN
ncbi:TetR/AcrR family transcriptional regulator [Pseudonocardia spinosispora]|uniref:TetR/AcrR family transcriptional regulator n=1 Tax=Pseudonocardia spinosispora TaxID=103441 RepID=UPI0004126A3E|nr:TetR/AcrR family transcriptional regulator [Pseudonocardia spinosispora]